MKTTSARIRLLACIASLLLSATFLWAAPRALTVTVIDQELGTPLQGVRLTVRGVSGVFATDADGKAALSLPEGGGALLITAALPGYQTKKSVISEKDTAVRIAMVLSGVVEGNELVVEKPKPNSTEAQSGVSQVVTKSDISNMKMGVMPDIMSTIKTLSGVSYTRGFNAMPSIQGGNPSEMTAELDGAYVLYPYHWNGAVSIFNPDMVESAMLSDGVASASYGQFLSGLLQVTSISPNKAQPTMNLNFSTDEVDVFASAPIGSTAGILLGGKVTYLQVPLALFGLAQDAPYITEGFGKLTWNPSPRVCRHRRRHPGKPHAQSSRAAGYVDDNAQRDLLKRRDVACQRGQDPADGQSAPESSCQFQCP
jgi:hypothetical protein